VSAVQPAWRRVYSRSEVGGSMAAGAPPKTFISDLRPGRVATFEATVMTLESIREVEQRSGGMKKVRNGTLKDGTGEISLVLWGTEVDLVTEGDKIRIVEGWVKDYKGRPQVSLGRTGKIERA
jgi:ssDNA-binding replication factor A large subunit